MSDRRLPDIQDRLREEVDRSWRASSLAEWMAQHQADVQDLLARGLNWDAAAQHFKAAGLKGPATQRQPAAPPPKPGGGLR